MNIYFCHEWCENSGLYIVAKTRGFAKKYFSIVTCIDFIDIRCNIHRKNVDETEEDSIDLGDSRLKKYDLYYCDEYGNEIQ